MAKYLFEAKYNADGMKGLMKEGGSKRRDSAERAIKSAGGKLESFYFAFGDKDVVGVVEFQDQASAAAHSGVVNASGTTTIKLTPLITVEEIDAAVRKQVQYQPPGR